MADYPVEFVVEETFWEDARWVYGGGVDGEPPAVGDEITITELGDEGERLHETMDVRVVAVLDRPPFTIEVRPL